MASRWDYRDVAKCHLKGSYQHMVRVRWDAYDLRNLPESMSLMDEVHYEPAPPNPRYRGLYGQPLDAGRLRGYAPGMAMQGWKAGDSPDRKLGFVAKNLHKEWCELFVYYNDRADLERWYEEMVELGQWTRRKQMNQRHHRVNC